MTRKLVIFFISCAAAGAIAGLWAGTQWAASAFHHHPALGARLRINDTHVYAPWQWLVWRSTWPPEMVAAARKPFGQAAVLLFLGIAAGMLPLAGWRLLSQAGNGRRRVREHGKDRWATLAELRAAGLAGASVRGAVVGAFVDRSGTHLLSFDGVEHQLVIGPSRSGKGVGHVVPTLLVWDASCFCYDVKGELWNVTAGQRSRIGHAFYWNPTRSDTARYNPLLEVRQDHAVGDAQRIAKMIVSPSGDRADDDIWDLNAEQLLVAVILHVLHVEPEPRKHLGVVRERVLDLSNTLIDMLELPHRTDADRRPEGHPEVRRVAASFADKTSRFRSSVVGTLEAYLTVFADERVVHATSACDFHMSDLACATRPVSLYVQVPPADAERLRPLTRLIVDQACRALLHHESEDAWGRPKHRRVLMMLDEFPSLGRVEAFAHHMKLMGSFGLKGVLVVQSVNDIISTYGTSNTILDKCHVVTAFATADVTSLDRLSRMTGTVTEYRESFSRPNRLLAVGTRGSISESEQVRPLMTPGDVRELPYDEQLILINGTKPIRTKKLVYHQHPQFAARVIDPPDQAARLDGPPTWESEWADAAPTGGRQFHPLARKLREELKRKDTGPKGPHDDVAEDAANDGDGGTPDEDFIDEGDEEVDATAEADPPPSPTPTAPLPTITPVPVLTPEVLRRRSLL